MLNGIIKKAAQQITGVPYILFLEHIHKTLKPQTYFEVGTSTGNSLACATCPTVSVDPFYQIDKNVFKGRSLTFMFQMSSDQFFRDHDLRTYFPKGADFSFLDGMHRFEFLLRDFMHTERLSHRQSLIAIHDCLPLNTRMAERIVIPGAPEEPMRDAWTGDVWKIIPVLKNYRPDLRVHFANAPPTGLVMVSGVDPGNRILFDNYYKILDEYINLDLGSYGFEALFSDYPTLNTELLINDPHMTTSVYSVF